jgi:hypothetical protein
MIEVPKHPAGYLTFDGTYLDSGSDDRVHVKTVESISYAPPGRIAARLAGGKKLLVLKYRWRTGLDRNSAKLLVPAEAEPSLEELVVAVNDARDNA